MKRLMKNHLVGVCLVFGISGFALMGQNRAVIGGGPGTTPSGTGILTGNPPAIIASPGALTNSPGAPLPGGVPGLGNRAIVSGGAIDAGVLPPNAGVRPLNTNVLGGPINPATITGGPGTVGGLGSGSAGTGIGANRVGGLGSAGGGFGRATNAIRGLGTGSGGVGTGVGRGLGSGGVAPGSRLPVAPVPPVPATPPRP